MSADTARADANGWFKHGAISDTECRSCFCVGPQNGDPVCPCAMPGYTRRLLAESALQFLMREAKPKVRVKAGSRPIPHSSSLAPSVTADTAGATPIPVLAGPSRADGGTSIVMKHQDIQS